MIGCFSRHEKISDPREFVLWWWKSLNPQVPRSFQIQSMTNLVGAFFCTRGLTPLFLWNILRWSGRSHHIPHLQSYFRDGLKPQLAFNKPDAVRQQFLMCWDSSGFSGKKKPSVYLDSGRQVATATWSLQLFKILITCGALFRAPDLKFSEFVGWIKINLRDMTDKLIGFINSNIPIIVF